MSRGTAAHCKWQYSSVVVIGLTVAVGLASVTTSTPAVAQQQDSSPRAALYDFNIPAGDLSGAIATLGAVTGLVIIVDSDRLERSRTQGLQGRYSADAALARLLYGTGLSHRFVSANQVRLVAAPADRLSRQSQVSALSPVTVTASRDRKEETYTTPASVSVITREDMDRMVVRNAGDALEGTPGVFVKNDRSSPALVVNVRGLEGRQRVTVSIDGARQNFQKSGHGASEGEVYVDSELLAGIDVTKGLSSGVGGAGSIAGVVNFRTLEADDLLRGSATTGGRVNLTTGSNGYHFQGSAAVAQRLGDNLELVGAVSRRNIGDFKYGTRNAEINGNAGAFALTKQQSWSGLFKSTWRPTDDQAIKLSYVGYDTDSMAADVGEPTSSGWKVRTGTLSLGYALQPADNPLLDLNASLYYVRTRFDQQYGSVAGSSYGTRLVRYQTETLGGSITNISQWNPSESVALSLRYGGEFFHDWTTPGFSSTGDADAIWYTGPTPEGKRTVGGVFVEAAAAHISGFELIAGLRYDGYRVSGSGEYQTCYTDPNGLPQTRPCYRTNEPGVRPQYTAFYTAFNARRSAAALLPKVTLAYTPPALQGLQVYGSYGKGVRPPTITEMLFHGEHVGGTLAFIPNPGLIEERSRNLELGANLMLDGAFLPQDKLRVKTAVFDNRVTNYIDSAAVLGPISTATNLLSADNAYVNFESSNRYRGWELALDYDAGVAFGAINFTRIYRKDSGGAGYNLYPLGSQVGYPVSNFEDVQALFGQIISGYGTVNLPDRSGTATLGVRLFDRKLTLGWRARYQRLDGRPFGNNSNESFSNWTVHDLFAVWKVSKTLELRLAVNNVRDQVYGEITSSAGSARRMAPGRTTLVSAAWTF